MNIDAIAVAADLENEAREQIDLTLLDREVIKWEDIKNNNNRKCADNPDCLFCYIAYYVDCYFNNDFIYILFNLFSFGVHTEQIPYGAISFDTFPLISALHQ